MRKHILFTLWVIFFTTILSAQKKMCKTYQKIIQQEVIAFNQQDMVALEKVYASDIRFATNQNIIEGKQAILAWMKKDHEENDGLKMVINDQICSKNGVTLFWTLSGYNKLADIPFSLEGVQFIGINKKGKINEIRGQFDQLGAFLKGGYTLVPSKSPVAIKKQLVDQFTAAHSTQNTALLDHLLTPDFTRIAAGDIQKGIVANKLLLAKNHLENPGLRVKILDYFSHENGIATIANFSGNSGISNRPFSIQAIQNFTIKDDKIHQLRAEFDLIGGLTQGGFELKPPSIKYTADQKAKIATIKQFHTIITTGDLSSTSEVVAANFTRNMNGVKLEDLTAWKANIEATRKLYPDLLSIPYKTTFLEKNKVLHEFTIIATPPGAVYPSNVKGMSIFEFDDHGKLVNEWGETDVLGAYLQGGYQLVPPKPIIGANSGE